MTCSFGSVVKRGPWRSSEDVSPLRASNTFASAILITHLPYLYDGVLAAGHATAYPELVVVLVYGDYLKITHRGRLVAHLARNLLALEYAGRVGRRADGAGLPDVVRAVAHRASGEAVALDGPLEALALGGGADVHHVAGLEHAGADGLADLTTHAPQLLEVLVRGRVYLGERAAGGLVDPAGVHGPEAHLDGLVAVVFGGADGRDHVRLHLDDGNADERPVVQEGLGHPSLASVYCRCHNPKSPLSLCLRQPAGRASATSRPCAAS